VGFRFPLTAQAKYPQAFTNVKERAAMYLKRKLTVLAVVVVAILSGILYVLLPASSSDV
jgi:hypothetical protein